MRSFYAGNNSFGQLGLGRTVCARKTREPHTGFATNARPSFITRMSRREGQCRMPSMISIAAGSWHSLALTEDGLVLAWGAHVEVCVCV